MAYSMITIYGMDETVGNVSFYAMSKDSFSKPFSETTAALIDEKVRGLISDQYKRAKSLLKEKQNELDKLANTLLDKEVLTKSDVEHLIGKRPFPDQEHIHLEEPESRD
jgi:cell division protease FtsH